ncbi:MAG TPA: hypothetical protein PK812_12425 [Beijerinckiaceae bacterium]|nr:hypothetical protein [Beijerinckiaceae bacterium]
MDVNIVYECIGYGTGRAVTSQKFAMSPSRIPARFILETAKDPVAYCIEAYAERQPDRAGRIDRMGRALILRHLEREAGLRSH